MSFLKEFTMILSCSNISKSFGEKHILKQVSFHLEDHEKAAIVGINGAGKSTLLKIIIGELASDEGCVALGRGASIGYLAQHQDLNSESTIHDALLEVKSGAADAAGMDFVLANTLAGTGDYSDLMVIPDLELSVEEYGIGFRQGSDLTAAVNQAMQELIDDGTLNELAAKYELADLLLANQ